MPPANKSIQHGDLLRAFIYGADKTKKTWWALRAAEAGFNVVLLDGDGGSSIVRQIKPEFHERILIADLLDSLDRAVFAEFMAMFLREGNSFTWDEDDRQFVLRPKAEHAHLVVDSSKLGPDTVLIVDSWTALAASTVFRYALENNLDLSDAARTDWDGYGWQGRFLTFVAQKLKALRCHVIVIGHQTVYEKRSSDGKTVLSSRTVPVSSSNNHAMALTKNFNEVLYFQALGPSTFKVSASGGADLVAGSRVLEPRVYDWDKCTPMSIMEKLGIHAPEQLERSEAFRWYAPGEVPEVKKPNIGVIGGAPKLDAENAKTISAGVTTTGETKPSASAFFAKKS